MMKARIKIMKNFKKAMAMGLATMAAVSAMSMPAMAADNVQNMDIETETSNSISPRVSYNGPDDYLDIATSFSDTFNGFHTNGYSDFYFDCGIGESVHFSLSSTARLTEPNEDLKVYVVERRSNGTEGDIIDEFSFTSNASGKLSGERTINKFDYENQNFYLVFETSPNVKAYGSYTIVQN